MTTVALPPVPSTHWWDHIPQPELRLMMALAEASVRWECNARLYVSEPKEVNQCAE